MTATPRAGGAMATPGAADAMAIPGAPDGTGTGATAEQESPARSDLRRRPARAVLALALVEGRRLLLHPTVLVVPVLSLLFLGSSGLYLGALVYLFLIGIGFFALGSAALVAANLNTLRARRHGTEELFESLPLAPAARTVAHVLATAFPVSAALTVAAALAAYVHPWKGASVRLDMTPRMVMHGPVDFLQGPLLVALLAVLGVLLARWVPHPAVAVPTVVGLFFALSMTVWSPDPTHWLGLLSGYGEKAPEPPGVMALHLAYLAALTALAGALSVLRHSRGMLVRAVTVGSAVVLAATGVLQVLVAS